MSNESAATAAVDFTTWLAPHDALSRVAEVLSREQARSAIWERLNGGAIKAVSTSHSKSAQGSEPRLISEPTSIPGNYWSHYQQSGPNLWQTGDARFYIAKNPYAGEMSLTIRCFGIKFDPVGVQTLIDSVPKRPPPPSGPGDEALKRPPHFSEFLSTPPDAPRVEVSPVSPPIAQESIEEPETKGPSVSPAHLQAWFNLYREVYKGKDDTEPNAIASAQGMFPGKSVSRQRIRDLRGKQKRGPKTGEER